MSNKSLAAKLLEGFDECDLSERAGYNLTSLFGKVVDNLMEITASFKQIDSILRPKESYFVGYKFTLNENQEKQLTAVQKIIESYAKDTESVLNAIAKSLDEIDKSNSIQLNVSEVNSEISNFAKFAVLISDLLANNRTWKGLESTKTWELYEEYIAMTVALKILANKVPGLTAQSALTTITETFTKAQLNRITDKVSKYTKN